MKVIVLAVLLSFVMVFFFIIGPRLIPSTPVSGATTPPDPLETAVAVSGHDIQIEDKTYRIERLTCPDIGTPEGDAAFMALAKILDEGETRCLTMNDTTLRCVIADIPLADVMQDRAGCRKD